MMKKAKKLLLPLLCLIFADCADDQPFMTGYIKRAFDAVMTPCDPYNKGALHTCVVFSSAFQNSLIVYDATAEELVLSPMRYFPLRGKVGPATDTLVTVQGAGERFPYLLALDPVEEALYVVRSFPSEDKKELSFQTPVKQELPKLTGKPYKMGALLSQDSIAVIISYPDAGSVQILSLDAKSGLIESAKTKTLSVGSRPGHIALVEKQALVSDQGADALHLIDLNEIEAVWQGSKALAAQSFAVGMKTNRVYAQARDFGQGLKSYAALLENGANELKLFNISDTKLEASLTLSNHPEALYFPDLKSEPCCDGEKNWLAAVGTTGHLMHIAVKENGGKLELAELRTTDLTSEKNMSLSQLTVQKIIGGQVIFDPSLKRDKQCPPHSRRMFFISSYARDKPYFDDLIGSGGNEVEAQGQTCEGETSASRLGTVDNEPRARVAVQQ